MKSYSIFEINDILKGTIIGSTSQNITSTERTYPELKFLTSLS